MLKKRITMLVLVSMIILPFLIAATEATTQIKTDNFVIEFKKPPVNKFFFSDPANPSNPYDVGKGVVFSFAKLNQASAGYPSSAMFAITYKFESSGLFEVYANADINHASVHRLFDSNVDAGLNYKIDIFANKANADNGESIEKTIEATASAADTIYSVNITSPMTQAVSKVFKLSLKSQEISPGKYAPYVEGQYTGYLIMEFTPSV